MPLPPVAEQLVRLQDLGLLAAAGLSSPESVLWNIGEADADVLVAVDPDAVPVSRLLPCLEVAGHQAFVVEDLHDVDDFLPIDSARPPRGPIYLVHGVDRGDALANWTPNDALVALESAARTPLTLSEGVTWLLQQPETLQRNHCFMTAGSRRRRPDGSLDARVPAIWISNGTGRDGRQRRGAPKVGWCWAGNRHTWLGFASGRSRSSLDDASQGGR